MLDNLKVIIENYRREATAILLTGFVLGVILGGAVA
jgi:hypothetical protein